MQSKNGYKCLTITALLTQLAVFPSSSFAEQTKKSVTSKMEQQESQQEKIVTGFVGQYFTDNQFKDIAFIQAGEKNTLLDENIVKQDTSLVQSIRWEGTIKPSETGDYILSTSSDENVEIKINGEPVLKKTSMEKALKLEKDNMYSVVIEYQVPKHDKKLQLFWKMNEGEKVSIPEKNILTPNFPKQIQPQGRSIQQQDPNDWDGDKIPNTLEENGYTFKDNAIVPWNDSYSAQGYKKYVSNSQKSRTTADPYTDYEKVTGRMPAATKDEARDPLVAAYPSVGVGMERLLFSRNENVVEGASGTVSKSITETKSYTNTVDIGGSVGFGKDGFSFSVSPKYSHSWTSSTSIDNTESSTWSSQVGINPAERAYLNANVRYHNSGSAPIYELRPTTNFVLQHSGASVTTITAGPNQIGNSLAPGATYPAKGQAPISWDKANEAGTVRPTLNGEQFDKIQSGADPLNLETTQNRGQYGILDESGKLITDASKQWDPIRTDIDAVSGALALNLGKGKESLERRIAAKNSNDPEDKTPEITLKEAIQKAFNAREKNGRLMYTNQEGKDISLDESAVNIVLDENTKREVENQLNQMQEKKVYNIKWKRGMKVTIHVPDKYYDFENANENVWHNAPRYNGGGYTGVYKAMIDPGKTGYSNESLQLKPYTSYTARAYLRTGANKNANATFYIGEGNNVGNGVQMSGDLQGNEWKMVEIAFNTGSNPEYFKNIGVKHNGGNERVVLDDVSLTEWMPTENIEKKHVFEKWVTSAENVESVIFSKIPDSKVRYQLEIDGVFTDIRSDATTDNNGKRTIDLKKFNHGQGIHTDKKINIYAVDEQNNNLKVKVAKFEKVHRFDSWIMGAPPHYHTFVDGVHFKSVNNNQYNLIRDYKVTLTGQISTGGKIQTKTETRPKYELRPDGKIKINFTEYFGHGVKSGVGTGHVQIWAIDYLGEETLVLDKNF